MGKPLDEVLVDCLDLYYAALQHGREGSFKESAKLYREIMGMFEVCDVPAPSSYTTNKGDSHSVHKYDSLFDAEGSVGEVTEASVFDEIAGNEAGADAAAEISAKLAQYKVLCLYRQLLLIRSIAVLSYFSLACTYFFSELPASVVDSLEYLTKYIEFSVEVATKAHARSREGQNPPPGVSKDNTSCNEPPVLCLQKFVDRISESCAEAEASARAADHRRGHAWPFAPAMVGHEALLFCCIHELCHDSSGAVAHFQFGALFGPGGSVGEGSSAGRPSTARREQNVEEDDSSLSLSPLLLLLRQCPLQGSCTVEEAMRRRLAATKEGNLNQPVEFSTGCTLPLPSSVTHLEFIMLLCIYVLNNIEVLHRSCMLHALTQQQQGAGARNVVCGRQLFDAFVHVANMARLKLAPIIVKHGSPLQSRESGAFDVLLLKRLCAFTLATASVVSEEAVGHAGMVQLCKDKDFPSSALAGRIEGKNAELRRLLGVLVGYADALMRHREAYFAADTKEMVGAIALHKHPSAATAGRDGVESATAGIRLSREFAQAVAVHGTRGAAVGSELFGSELTLTTIDSFLLPVYQFATAAYTDTWGVEICASGDSKMADKVTHFVQVDPFYTPRVLRQRKVSPASVAMDNSGHGAATATLSAATIVPLADDDCPSLLMLQGLWEKVAALGGRLDKLHTDLLNCIVTKHGALRGISSETFASSCVDESSSSADAVRSASSFPFPLRNVMELKTTARVCVKAARSNKSLDWAQVGEECKERIVCSSRMVSPLCTYCPNGAYSPCDSCRCCAERNAAINKARDASAEAQSPPAPAATEEVEDGAGSVSLKAVIGLGLLRMARTSSLAQLSALQHSIQAHCTMGLCTTSWNQAIQSLSMALALIKDFNRAVTRSNEILHQLRRSSTEVENAAGGSWASTATAAGGGAEEAYYSDQHAGDVLSHLAECYFNTNRLQNALDEAALAMSRYISAAKLTYAQQSMRLSEAAIVAVLTQSQDDSAKSVKRVDKVVAAAVRAALTQHAGGASNSSGPAANNHLPQGDASAFGLYNRVRNALYLIGSIHARMGNVKKLKEVVSFFSKLESEEVGLGPVLPIEGKRSEMHSELVAQIRKLDADSLPKPAKPRAQTTAPAVAAPAPAPACAKAASPAPAPACAKAASPALPQAAPALSSSKSNVQSSPGAATPAVVPTASSVPQQTCTGSTVSSAGSSVDTQLGSKRAEIDYDMYIAYAVLGAVAAVMISAAVMYLFQA